MNSTLKVLSILVGVLSLVSFAQEVLSFGFTPMMDNFIGYYRGIAHTFISYPARLVGISLPGEIIDFWALSFIGAGAYIRTPNIENTRFLRKYNFNPISTKGRVGIFAAFGVSGLGVAIFLAALNPMTYTDSMNEESQAVMRQSILNALLVVIGCVFFFVINAFAPSA